jgi:uncharacterized membrane-anchored protein YitT (DUF2179 family)
MIFKRKKEHVQTVNDIQQSKIVRFAQFLSGIFIISFAYNIFMKATNAMYGIGGVAIVVHKIFNVQNYLFILIANVLLLLLSYILLGKKVTARSALGSIIYPLCIHFTEWMVPHVHVSNLEVIVMVVSGAIATGFGLGLVFRSGYTTGGTDILDQIISKYLKLSIGKAMIIVDGLVIVLCSLAFGFEVMVYSIITLYIVSLISDKVIIGISQSKVFYIITDNETSVKKYLIQKLNHGVTVLQGRGGYTGDNQKVIMCIIPTREYHAVKEEIKKLDPNAFFLVTDSYEVSGGA